MVRSTGSCRVPKRILVSTICRHSHFDQPSGFVILIDLDVGRPVHRLPVPEPPLRGTDPNPRGGMRGARGIAVAGDTLFVANYSSVFQFDHRWRMVGSCSHPLCADIHDIAYHDGQLWVTSTRNDLLLALHLDGRIAECIDPWQSEAVQALTDGHRSAAPSRSDDIDFRDPRTHDKTRTDQLHLNGFATSADGFRLTLGQVRTNGRPLSAVLKLASNAGPSLETQLSDAVVPSHNLLPWDADTYLHLHSAACAVLAVDVRGGVFTEIGRYEQGFLRGLCRLDATHYAVGARNCLLVFRFGDPTPLRRIAISSSPNESIHTIAALPEDFPLTFPPLRR